MTETIITNKPKKKFRASRFPQRDLEIHLEMIEFDRNNRRSINPSILHPIKNSSSIQEETTSQGDYLNTKQHEQ